MSTAVLSYPPLRQSAFCSTDIAIAPDSASKDLSLAMAALQRHLTLK